MADPANPFVQRETNPATATVPSRRPSKTGGARPGAELLRPAADLGTTNPVIPTDPIGFQTYLKALGANLGTTGPKRDGVDGVIGPTTLAEAARLQVPVPATLAPKPKPAAAPAPAVAPAPAPAAPPVSAPVTMTAPPAAVAPTGAPSDRFISAVQNLSPGALAAQFGYGAWVLNNPELMGIINAAAQADQTGTPWTDAQFQTAIQKTAWWTGQGNSQRAWQAIQGTGEGNAQLADMSARLDKIAQSQGIVISPDRMKDVAADALARGLTGDELNTQVANEFRYKPGAQTGAIGAAEATMRMMADDYIVNISDSTMADWDRQIAMGTASPDTFKQYLISQAQSLYPGMAGHINAGVTTKMLADPYAQAAATELGINADTVNFHDQKWSMPLNQTDDKGNRSMMGLDDWKKTLRSNPVYGWDKTANGIASGYQMANAITSAMGVRV